MGKILDCKKLAEEIKAEVADGVANIEKKHGKLPTLAVIMVGENPASAVYVRNKEKACKACGITSLKHDLPEDTTEEEVLALVDKLNRDRDVNGILVQLPLPKHMDEAKVMAAVDFNKDVDGFHLMNVGKLFAGQTKGKNAAILACTPKGCIKILKNALGDDLSGRKACVIGRSNIVGRPVSALLLHENCSVKTVHSRTKNLAEETKWADIIVVAIGKPKFLTADMVSPGCTVVDVGINRTDDGLCGDADTEALVDMVEYITPVPGGVGVMTVACLMENVFEAFMRQNNFDD